MIAADAIYYGLREGQTPTRNGVSLSDAAGALREGGGGTLKVRPGRYQTDREWLFEGIKNVWIDGRGAELVYEGPGGGRLMTATSAKDSRCEYFRADGLVLDGGGRTSGVLNILHGPGNNIQTSLSSLRIQNGGHGEKDYGLVIGEGGDQNSPYIQVSELRFRDSVVNSHNQVYIDSRFANVLRFRDVDFMGDLKGIGITMDGGGPLSLIGCSAGANDLDISLTRDMTVAPILRIQDWHSESSARFFAQHGSGTMGAHISILQSSIAMTGGAGGFRVTGGGHLSIRDTQLSGAEPGLVLEPSYPLAFYYDGSSFAQNPFGFVAMSDKVIPMGNGASSSVDQGFAWMGSFSKGLHYDATTKTVTVRP